MKNCEYCSYFKNGGEAGMKEGDGAYACTFTDTILRLEDLTEREYICNDVSYQQYQARLKARESMPKEKVGDMKFIYRTAHTKEYRAG